MPSEQARQAERKIGNAFDERQRERGFRRKPHQVSQQDESGFLDAETARSAILAGAGFIVAPTLNLDMVALCNRYRIPVIPGCYTPTEMLTAWEAGADMAKLFPASIGGPSLVKAILAPLPQLEIVPVGGVNLDTAAAFIKNGAVALGVGSSLINQKLLDAGDMEELTRRAAAFIEQVKKGRGLS